MTRNIKMGINLKTMCDETNYSSILILIHWEILEILWNILVSINLNIELSSSSWWERM